MRWPTYPKYKDSGVDWIGEMPEEWDTLKLKYCVKGILQYGANEPTGSNALDQPRYIRITDLNDDGTLNPETFCSISYETAKPYLLSDKDVLLARSGATVGKSFLYRKEFGEAAYAGYLIRASTNNKLIPEFLYLFLQSSAYWQWLNSVFIKSTIQNVSAEKYAALILAVPSIDEQKEIIQFIFDKIDQYNALIAEQEKLIALLQEKRQAVISHAVTKGLNPDAPMKDSGVEWLGSVPKHWRILPLKRCLREPLKYGANEAAELLDPNLPRYIRITDLRDDGTLNPDTFRSLPYEIAESYLLADGDVLLARSGATVGKSFIFRESMGCAAYAGYLIKASTTKLLVPDFLYLFSQSFGYWQWVNSIFIKSTIQNISAEKYGSLALPVPPRAEQVQIVKFIERTAKDIDSLMEMTSNSMALLRGRRTALISAAVTGKIDVRGLTASEPA